MAQNPGSPSPVLPSRPEAAPALRACLFALAGSRFAVDVRSAREVAVFDDITGVPRAPRHLIGIANLRGTVMPIVDVRDVLGLPESRPARSVRTLVLRDGPLQAAVVVDTVLGLEPFDEVLPPDAPSAARIRGPRAFVSGWLEWAGETLALLDVPRVLAALRVGTPGGSPESPAHGEPA
jgi:purine-binding chemotaxis protein CheW